MAAFEPCIYCGTPTSLRRRRDGAATCPGCLDVETGKPWAVTQAGALLGHVYTIDGRWCARPLGGNVISKIYSKDDAVAWVKRLA